MPKNSSSPSTQPKPFPKLQKFLADSGVCSRRAGEELIKSGQVSVNGEIAQLGLRVNPERDVIKVGQKRIQSKFTKPVVYVVNKPKGFTCSNEDPYAERLIFELLEARHRNTRLFCAGRLDVDSEGLVILTNDGKLAHRLTHPSQQVRKKYQVEINEPLENDAFRAMLDGFGDEGEFLQLDEIRSKSGNPVGSTKLEIIMGHGKKREIRRCLNRFRYRVKKLRRVAIGGLRLGKLPLGTYRDLKDAEIDLLFPKQIS
ncbi:MAG TPA: rRNA pseudouridine synthase [Opitutae bacterium]|nr:rRNA pseudouridine synthase [Opitutae bacterium]